MTIAELMGAIASMTAGGVLDRHPGLRCAFLEGTAGWLGRPPGRDRAAASCCPRTALRWLGPIRMAHRSTGSEPLLVKSRLTVLGADALAVENAVFHEC